MLSSHLLRRSFANPARRINTSRSLATASAATTGKKALSSTLPLKSTTFVPRQILQPPTRQFHQSSLKMAGGVHELNSANEFHQALNEKGSLMVLDCYATWCGPCKVISPQVEKFSNQYTQARFFKLDVDKVAPVAEELGIRAMPTFIFFKDGEKINEVVGANPKAIIAAIEENA